jgi:hypothetical protein
MAHESPPDQRIAIVSIHDGDTRGFLSFDLCQVLESIGDLVAEYSWVVTGADCVGLAITEGTFLSTADLLSQSRGLTQMIDGIVMGLPTERLTMVSVEQIVQLEHFPTLPTMIAIVAVDSTFYEVISKRAIIIERIKARFADVRDCNPADYFGSSDTC